MLTSLPKPPRLLSEPRMRELWLTYHEDLRGSPKIRAVIDWLTEAYPASDRCLCGKC